jgi:hypothetical protein
MWMMGIEPINFCSDEVSLIYTTGKVNKIFGGIIEIGWVSFPVK